MNAEFDVEIKIEEPDETIETEDLEEPSEKWPNLSSFSCPYCSIDLTNEETLTNHLNDAHSVSFDNHFHFANFAQSQKFELVQEKKSFSAYSFEEKAKLAKIVAKCKEAYDEEVKKCEIKWCIRKRKYIQTVPKEGFLSKAVREHFPDLRTAKSSDPKLKCAISLARRCYENREKLEQEPSKHKFRCAGAGRKKGWKANSPTKTVDKPKTPTKLPLPNNIQIEYNSDQALTKYDEDLPLFNRCENAEINLDAKFVDELGTLLEKTGATSRFLIPLISQLKVLHEKASDSLKKRIAEDLMSKNSQNFQDCPDSEDTQNDFQTDKLNQEASDRVLDLVDPKIGDFWQVKHKDNFLFAQIVMDNPLIVNYFEPSGKGKFYLQNDTTYEAFPSDLFERVQPPEVIQKEGGRKFFKFV